MLALKSIHEYSDLTDLIETVGFLPLLGNTVPGFSAEDLADADCCYHRYSDGSWDWPLWSWKGPAVRGIPCVYGKFFDGKAGFVSMTWWPDLMNYRRSLYPEPEENSVERMILEILQLNGAMITRDLRKACGFTGGNMRSRFDHYVTRLQMECRIVTEDFVYPVDKHGQRYGFGWAQLNTPENAVKNVRPCRRSPQASLDRMLQHLRRVLPHAEERSLRKLLE